MIGLAVWVVVVAGRTDRPAVVIAAGAAALAGVATGGRWWLPFVTLPAMLVAVTGGGLPDDGGNSDSPFVLLLMWSAYLAGRHGPGRRQPWNVALGFAYVALVTGGSAHDVSQVVFPLLVFFGPLFVGFCVQTLATQADRARRWASESEAARERQVQHAVLEERMTIARELHDIVAHRISALSLQAQVVRRSIEAGKPVAAEQVRTIETTAQQSMTDLRRLLGLLRPDGERADLDPQASLDDLSNLLETARSTGHPVRFTQSGTPRPLPPAISLAAYRIVQEALTNARRHGAPGLTVVRLDWGDSALHLDIVNPVHAGQRPGTAGHGLLGMAERVRLFGGSLSTGSDREGWAVRATLPMPIMEHAAR
jgi:signal transduction histidine kinase